MSTNPYAPSENWNTGEQRRSGGAPLWALLVACLSTLALGCFGGIVAGFVLGFAAGESATESIDGYLDEPGFTEVSVVARAVAPASDDATAAIEVLISNNADEPRWVDAIDIYHDLVAPEEIVLSEPAFNATDLYEDEDDASGAWTEYAFDPIMIPPGRTVSVRFEVAIPAEERRTGDVDVWVDGDFIRAHVHMHEGGGSATREPGY